MFRRHSIPVDIRPSGTDNNLTVIFNSSAVYDVMQQDLFKSQHGVTLPQNFSFSRKPAYQYGWDWGPRILTVGIWKPVHLKCYLNDDPVAENISMSINPITKENISISGKIRVQYSHLKPN